MSEQETVEVTLKLPKPFFEFLQAVKKFSRDQVPVEELCTRYLMDNIIGMLKGNNIGEVFDSLDREHLIAAYGLDKIHDC